MAFENNNSAKLNENKVENEIPQFISVEMIFNTLFY